MELDVQCPASYPDGYKMVIVGEAPGKEEVDAKAGFVGAAGRCLQKACRAAGVDWTTVGLSNVVKRRPSATDNDFRKAFYETIEEPVYTPTGKLSKRTSKTTLWTAEMSEWVHQLADELRQKNPNLVVAAGNEAFCAITGLSGITNYRGSIVESRGAFTRPDGHPLQVLAVEHPSYIIRGQLTDFWILAQDLRKAKRAAETPEIQRESWNELIRPRLDYVLYHLNEIAENPRGLWTLDVETRAGTLACLAVGYRDALQGKLTSVCIPVQTSTEPYWSAEDECEIWRALAATCAANPYLCNQNIEYDIYYLLRYAIEPSGVWMDTMLAHNLLYPEFPKGLDFLCSWYLDDVVYYKGEGRNWSAGDRDEELWRYNVKDAVYTLRVVEAIDKQLKERGMYEFYHGSAV